MCDQLLELMNFFISSQGQQASQAHKTATDSIVQKETYHTVSYSIVIVNNTADLYTIKKKDQTKLGEQ